MKKKHKITLTVLVLILVLFAINKITYREFRLKNRNEKVLSKYEFNDVKYKMSLPSSSTLEISNNLEKIINESINNLDSNFFLKGRDNSKMVNQKMINQVINNAKKGGGSASGNTFFKNLLNKEMVAFTIYTETNPDALKLINRFTKYNERFKINEIWFKYVAKIKIEYQIKVGNNEDNNFYYENTVICSPAKLI